MGPAFSTRTRSALASPSSSSTPVVSFGPPPGRPHRRLHPVLTLHLAARMLDAVGEFPVVGHEEQPLRVAVEPAHVRQPGELVGQHVVDGRPSVRVAARGEHPGRFVERDPARGLRGHELAVQLHPVALRIDARSELDHHLAVHLHAPLLHEALRLATRRLPRLGEVLLDADALAHGWSSWRGRGSMSGASSGAVTCVVRSPASPRCQPRPAQSGPGIAFRLPRPPSPAWPPRRPSSLLVLPVIQPQRNPLAQHDGQLLRPRQVFQRAESEVLEEVLRGPVQEGPAQPFCPPHHVDQPPLLQRSDDARRAHPADILHLEPGQRLPVRDDRERFERGPRQSRRPGDVVEAFQIARELGAGEDLVSLGQLHDLERPVGVVVLGAQRLEHGLDLVFIQRLVRTRDLVRGERRIGREQDGFHDLLRIHAWAPSSFS
jgi:hypothetical protein